MALSKEGESDYSMWDSEYKATSNMTFVEIKSMRRLCSFLSNNVKNDVNTTHLFRVFLMVREIPPVKTQECLQTESQGGI